jgi:ATP-binding cassette subfamily F protein uup
LIDCRLSSAEPTNDLDLPSINVLEEFLMSYNGVLVVVSHDRYFLDRVCDHHFVLSADDTGEVLDWQGTFSEYLEYRDAKAATELEKSAKAEAKAVAMGPGEGQSGDLADDGSGGTGAPKAAKDASKPLSNFEVREMERLEAELEALNEKQEGLQRQVSSFDNAKNGYEELARWTEEAEAMNAQIEAVEEKWLALAERA